MARNVKGLIFGLLGTVAGYIVGNIVEDKLNDNFNPELRAAQKEEKACLKAAISTVFETPPLDNEVEQVNEEETSE